jgi:hypothetical protein
MSHFKQKRKIMALLLNNLKNNFSTIPNDIITDKNLSHGAKLVFIYLASKPDKWEVYNQDIKKSLNIGQDKTIAKYFKELTDNGWIKRHKKTNDKKQFIGGFDYELFPQAQLVKNHNVDNAKDGKNHRHSNTKPTVKLNIEEKYIKEFSCYEDIQHHFSNIDDYNLKHATIIAYYLHFKIVQHKPNTKKEPFRWIKDIQLAISKDNRTVAELRACIDFIYHTEKGAFWIPNILSGKKLREKFDQLELQASNNPINKTASVVDAVSRANAQGVAV